MSIERQPYMDDSDYIKELEAKVKQLQAENESISKAVDNMTAILNHPKTIVAAHPYPHNLD